LTMPIARFDPTAASMCADARAFVLLKSRRRLDLLNPDPQAWTDDDLVEGLSRTMRVGVGPPSGLIPSPSPSTA